MVFKFPPQRTGNPVRAAKPVSKGIRNNHNIHFPIGMDFTSAADEQDDDNDEQDQAG